MNHNRDALPRTLAPALWADVLEPHGERIAAIALRLIDEAALDGRAGDWPAGLPADIQHVFRSIAATAGRTEPGLRKRVIDAGLEIAAFSSARYVHAG